MAIAQTGAIYKSLIFDGEDSRDYGVYITGEAVYNAPQRAVEMISIPNRNGAFALDKGYFENIEVTYPAGIFADSETNFAQAISDFRNFLCSRKGYVRLSDEYNPDEYRMAVYKSGLEVSPTQLRAGEFEITFDCKPQRFLTSGEDEITMGQWGEIQTVSGSIATFEGNGATGIKSLVAEIDPIQAGSGTPSPSNPRAISGWTSVTATRTGKNLCPNTAEIGTAWNGSSNSARARIIIPCKPNTTYTLSMNGTMSVDGVYRGTSPSIPASSVAGPTNFPVQITTGASDNYITLGFNKTAIAQSDVDALKLQLELGTTATAYEQYNGETATISLGQTVYGGTLDVVSGVLTIDRAIVDLGSLSWTYNNTSYSYGFFNSSALSDRKVGRLTNAICSCYVVNQGDRSGMGGSDAQIASFNTTNANAVCVRDDRYTNAATFKTAVTGQKLVYELATPTTVQLTAQQLSAISGINNVWADSGDVTVQYGNAPNMIYNPTLFDARPLLEVEGYGNINIGDDTITLNDVAMGEIAVHDAVSKSSSASVNPYSYTFTFDDTNLNSGDVITISSAYGTFKTTTKADYYPTTCTITSTSSATGYCSSGGKTKRVTLENLSFTYGTASTVSGSVLFSQSYRYNNTLYTVNETITVAVFYVLPNKLTLRIDTGSLPPCFHVSNREVRSTKVYADSTKSALGHPTYIDLDIGEAYLISNGVPISLNNVASLPNELPVLKPDGTEITYDNTVTDLKVVPRWWRV